jgi:phosphoribosylglycinamide formyltransferase-1
MCGFMRYYDPPPPLARRVVNIHPSLLPSFGGRGMCGHRVHAAVVASGVKITGCSVHLVVGAYDTGPLLAQRVVPVEPGDDADAVEARVQGAERHLYPLVVAQLLAHGLPLRPHPAADEFDFGI